MTFKLSPQEEKGCPKSKVVPAQFRNGWLYFLFGIFLGFVLATWTLDKFLTRPTNAIQEISISYDLLKFQVSDIEAIECPRALADNAKYTPEQIHLSLGRADSSEIIITWSTMKPVKESCVYLRPIDSQFEYENDLNNVISIQGFAYTTTISDTNGKHVKNRTLYGYYANLTDLRSPQYDYYVMSSVSPSEECNSTKYFTSNPYTFRNPWYSDALGMDRDHELRVAIYGDLGLINGQSIPRLTSEVDKNMYDLIIHNGDFGYDLNDALGTVGDAFMRSIEPIAARVVYQTSVGNHEVAQNFSHYSHRFNMMNTENGKMNSFYYSFDLGPVHFIAYSTEFYYFLEYSGIEALVAQWNWLKDDLAKANRAESRALRPWIVAFGHRPMYCSDHDNDDCSKKGNILRKGLPIVGLFNLEKLFYEQGVDLVLEAHEHSYERFLPIYNGTVMAGKDNSSDPYFNPHAPVHVITGSAGCKEKLDPLSEKPATGSVRQISDYGYTRMFASFNALRMEQVSDDKDGDVLDKCTLVKSRLRNFPENIHSL